MSAVAEALRVAIAGNPNCGKTTIFNALTGLRQKVGNYPGVTVERKVGRFFGPHGEPMELVDLPGAYSLQVRSPDEAVSRDVLLGRLKGERKPDALVAVVDASNLERNLYLTAQLLELGIPAVVALNMVDVAERNGAAVDAAALSDALGVEVVPMVAPEGKGLLELKHALLRAGEKGPARRAPMPGPIAREVAALRPFAEAGEEAADAEALLLLSLPEPEAVLAARRDALAAVEASRARLLAEGVDPVSAPVEARYAWIQEVCDAAWHKGGSAGDALTDRLDAVLTHRVWGWPVFLAMMALIFVAIFAVAAYPMDWIERGFAWLGDRVGAAMPDGDLRSLAVDGVIAGVAGVMVFLPQIMVLFFFLGLLEDSGYMARAAFIMDRLMSRVGLHGKSFIPLLSSFACAIPGVMATRTIEDRKDRLVTILVAPLMSCSARLPVYALMIAVLAPAASVWDKAGIMLAMYVLGIAAAFGMAWLFKRTLLRGQTPMLLLELPPYRKPQWRSVALRMAERAMIFLKRAGTVILALSVLLWALATYPKAPEDAPGGQTIEYSIAGRMGHALEPLIAPLGYDWRIGIGLIGSFAAREVFVSTMNIVYSIEGGDGEDTAPLREAMAATVRPDGTPVFTPLVCVGLMVFYVLAMQCVSTVAVVRRETNSWRWPAFQIAYMTGLAWVGAFLVYQGGLALGFR